MSKLVAFYDACIVKPIEAEETVYGNIIVPDMGKESNAFGEVIAVGPGRFTINGTLLEPQVKVGDRVVLPTQGFTKKTCPSNVFFVYWCIKNIKVIWLEKQNHIHLLKISY